MSVGRTSRAEPPVASPCAAPDEPPTQSRFFFSGDGTVDLYNAHFPERLTVRYRRADGSYDAAALAQVERFFRSRTDGRQGPVSLRLIELIDFVQDRYRPERLTLVSGYRSPAMNAALRAGGGRVAEASLHTEGMAADLQPQGVDLLRMWNQLRALELGGVGFYRADGFFHLDTGKPRFWEAATAGTDKNLSKENARLFARTEFDRYADLDGARIQLHAVTALPIRIARTARAGDAVLPLRPLDPAVALENDCWVLSEPAARYAFTVAGAAALPPGRAPIRLRTCAARVGATPAEVLTNPVEPLR